MVKYSNVEPLVGLLGARYQSTMSGFFYGVGLEVVGAMVRGRKHKESKTKVSYKDNNILKYLCV